MSNPNTTILVIGYGNELRGDDAAGIRAVQMVEACHLQNVRISIHHQLVPELAESISQARAVIFTDASLEATQGVTEIRPIQPAQTEQFSLHRADPGNLLALAQALYGRCPPAWCVHIPAVSFDLGDPLSPTAEQGVRSACEKIKLLCVDLLQSQGG